MEKGDWALVVLIAVVIILLLLLIVNLDRVFATPAARELLP